MVQLPVFSSSCWVLDHQELLAEVRKLNDDPKAQVSLLELWLCLGQNKSYKATSRSKVSVFAQVHGILVQLPLPEHIKEAAVLKSIRVDKDADGFAAENASQQMVIEIYGGCGKIFSSAPASQKRSVETFLIRRYFAKNIQEHSILFGCVALPFFLAIHSR